jgi:hypothetical protein
VIPLILGTTYLEAAMMGPQTGDQASQFYEFRLQDRIPKDHLLRRISVFVVPILDSVREQLRPYYSEIGRPSPLGDKTPHRIRRTRHCLCRLAERA